MLESKVDKQIKRYLKKIAFEVRPSLTNESIHYFIMYDYKKIDVRFAEHTSYHSRAFIDIIKITDDLYRVNVAKQVQYTIYNTDIMSYLKALLLVGPELFKMVSEYQNKCHSFIAECEKVKKDCLNKLKHYDPEFMDQLWEEHDKAVELSNTWIRKNLNLEKELDLLKSKYSKADTIINNLKTLINNYK